MWITSLHLTALGCPKHSKWQKRVTVTVKAGRSRDPGGGKASSALRLAPTFPSSFFTPLDPRGSSTAGITRVQMLTGAYRWQQPSETVAGGGWVSAIHTLSQRPRGVFTRTAFSFPKQGRDFVLVRVKIFIFRNKTHARGAEKDRGSSHPFKRLVRIC